MAITEIYIDPSLNSNTGSGTIGDPYGDLQHACTSTTIASSGVVTTRFNIKSGTAEMLGADLSFTVSSGSSDRPVIFEGYTSTAGDGGRGEIQCTDGFIDSYALDNIKICNLDIIGSHTDYLIHLDRRCIIHNCYIEQGDTRSALYLDESSIVSNCHIKCLASGNGQPAVDSLSGSNCKIINSVVEYAGNDNAINYYNAYNNLVIVSGSTSTGIEIQAQGIAVGNIVYYDGSNGTNQRSGIVSDGVPAMLVAHNYVEGFTGTYSGAYKDSSSNPVGWTAYNNYYYNCTYAMADNSGSWPHDFTGSMQQPTVTSSSVLTNPGTGDYAMNSSTIRDSYSDPADDGIFSFYNMRVLNDDVFGGSGGSTDVSARFTRLR